VQHGHAVNTYGGLACGAENIVEMVKRGMAAFGFDLDIIFPFPLSLGHLSSGLVRKQMGVSVSVRLLRLDKFKACQKVAQGELDGRWS